MGKIKFMIEIITKSKRSNLYELKVFAMMSQLKFYCTSLESFERCFNDELAAMPASNIGAPIYYYKISSFDDNGVMKLQVHHLNNAGDPDRLIAIIQQKK